MKKLLTLLVLGLLLFATTGCPPAPTDDNGANGDDTPIVTDNGDNDVDDDVDVDNNDDAVDDGDEEETDDSADSLVEEEPDK